MKAIGRQHDKCNWTMDCKYANAPRDQWGRVPPGCSRYIKLKNFQPPVVRGTFVLKRFYSYRSSSGVTLTGDDGHDYDMTLNEFGEILKAVGFVNGQELTLMARKRGSTLLWSPHDPTKYTPCDDYDEEILAVVHGVDINNGQ